MGFVEAIKAGFANYFVFTGRARLSEFWWFILFVILGGIGFSIIDWLIFGIDPQTGEGRRVLSGLFHLAVLFPTLTVAWRRMHDTGRPGWYVLAPMLLSFAFMLFAFGGVFAFTMLEVRTGDPGALIGPAAMLGAFGMLAMGVLQLVLTVLMIWWLSRPSEPGDNQYGPYRSA
ncbi:DUF805 domain-containing protein [Pelagibacterium lacus]|uniref:DUF805 domain-containing protein n=1 Tax=Pelagibacterium lacus TaxID=2282655 RepID=A0A369W137_9HYPH|nr:DUF805 domain-containing protein [Pelagibacterium lacus]RDE08073.1 DUF805 domain-containing protein [Pelagibacterium lacus]